MICHDQQLATMARVAQPDLSPAPSIVVPVPEPEGPGIVANDDSWPEPPILASMRTWPPSSPPNWDRCERLPRPAKRPHRRLQAPILRYPVLVSPGRAGPARRPPHPGPFPLDGGEGESAAGFRNCEALASATTADTSPSPLPKGKGKGEGTSLPPGFMVHFMRNRESGLAMPLRAHALCTPRVHHVHTTCTPRRLVYTWCASGVHVV